MAFQKGQSGNPGGRPKENNEVKEFAREYTKEAIERLAFWMRSDNPKASVAASNALIERAWGKPLQQIEANVTRSYVARIPEKASDPKTWQQQRQPKHLVQ